jgi:2-methylisocitrate lyase-like PEP mutase family enzyme
MSSQPSPTSARQIVWPSVITVISAAILIGAEVFGAAFAGGWALAILFGLDDTGAHILQAVLLRSASSSWWLHPRRAARRAVYAAR